MAQTVKPVAEQASGNAKDATDAITAQGKRTADQITDVTREAADRAEDVARRGLHAVERAADAVGELQREVAHRSAEGAAELGRVLAHDAACFIDWFDPEAKAQAVPKWNYRHISEDVLPALRERGVSDADIDTMLAANPRRMFE